MKKPKDNNFNNGQDNNTEQVKQSKGVFKKILKYFGISVAAIAGVLAITVIIYAIQGGFNPNKKPMDTFSISVNGVAASEILVNDDFQVLLTYTPDDAKALDVTATVKSSGENVLSIDKSIVTAGTPFIVHVAKDENGNNLGGEADILFESENRMIRRTLKVMVDVALPNNKLEFTSTSEGIVYNETKSQTAGMDLYNVTVSPTITNHIILSSKVARSLNPSTGLTPEYSGELKNLANKKAYVFLSTEDITKGSVTQTATKKYQINLTARHASQETILTAYVHRLYSIQNQFNEQWLTGILNMPEYGVFAYIDEYNAFLNANLKYFVDENIAGGGAFFDALKQDVEKEIDGQIVIVNEVHIASNDKANLQQSLQYVFAVITSKFIVADVQIDNITGVDLAVNVLSSDEQTPTTIGLAYNDGGWNVKINPQVASDSNKAILAGRLGELVIGTYVKYNELSPVNPEQIVDGDTRKQYIEISGQWYEYNTTYAEVVKTESGWELIANYPNYNGNEFIGNPHVQTYLIYSIDNVDEEGQTTYRDTAVELDVCYHPNAIVLRPEDQMVLSASMPTQTVVITNPNSRYISSRATNTSVGVSDYANVGQVVTINELNAINQGVDYTDNSEYSTKVMWFVPYSTNFYEYDVSVSLPIFNLNNVVYLSNVNYTPLVVGSSDVYERTDGYTKWLLVDDADGVNMQALNACATREGDANGAKLYAMRMVVDRNGNLVTLRKTIAGEQVDTYIVSAYSTNSINYITTYIFTSADNLYSYVITSTTYERYYEYEYVEDANGAFVLDPITLIYREYNSETDDGMQRYNRGAINTLSYSNGDHIYLSVSPFILTDDGSIDTYYYTINTGASVEINYPLINNLKIGAYNYNCNVFDYKTEYVDYSAVENNAIKSLTVDQKTSFDGKAVNAHFETQNVTNTFNLNINVTKSVYEPIVERVGTSTDADEYTHRPLIISLQIV